MTDTLIKVDHVAKKFCRNLKRSLWYGVKDTAKELLGRSHGSNGHLRRDEFWALKDISFEVKRGECLGLLGRNGAGKSTLLKMLNGLLKPDAGRIEMHGRVAALIELGAGFNPILTGRENIYVNGAVLGFTKREIDRKFDAIVDFSELEEFIDSPVKNYSSGMKVRLGFAVAAQLEPDVLLIDEVLAVGDIGFKIKCYNEIYRLVKNAAVIFVSHSMPQVGKICSTGLVLKDGQVKVARGNIADAINAYNDLFTFGGITQFGAERAMIDHIAVSNTQDAPLQAFDESRALPAVSLEYGRPLHIQFVATVDNDVDNVLIHLSFIDMDQRNVAQCASSHSFINSRHPMHFCVTIDDFSLNVGTYALELAIKDATPAGGHRSFLIGFRGIVHLIVNGSNYIGAAPVQYPGTWRVVRFQHQSAFTAPADKALMCRLRLVDPECPTT